MRAAFIYPNPRAQLAREVAEGTAPDTGLLGENHLAQFGIDAYVHDSVLRRRHVTGGLGHRLSWLTREATLPWEVGDADVVVTPLATMFPLVARLRRRQRLLLISYGTLATWERASSVRRRLLRASLRSADAIVTISSAGKEGLVQRIGVSPARVTTALFGADARFWQPTAAPAGGHVLTVGRDLARDYRTFGEAMRGLPAQGIVVAKRENLDGLDLPPNVTVKSGISFDELRELYAGASCVVVPMVSDGDPRGSESSGNTALLEAMACGRATIATERSSLREYAYPDATVTVPGGDVAALRTAIEQLAADPGRAGELGAAGRTHVEQRHTSVHFAERLAAEIRKLAS
jgi:glycosyltransferase involved in cell wall biosynthesis